MTDYSELIEKITAYRRDLHQIQELGFYVYKTGAYIRNILEKMDCQIQPIAKTGIIAYFDFGRPETICFRADMDALPIQEDPGLPFASTIEGCMHACGHDGHMANLLGFANLLDDYKRENKIFKYNALLLFQPAEETIDGARMIAGTHLFDKFNVQAIFGLHLWPSLAKGEIATRPGPMMAHSTSIKITINGLSAHAAEPEKGHDALFAACEFIDNVYQYKTKNVPQRSILKFGKLESGTVLNAISDHTTIGGTMRTFEESTQEELTDAMQHYAEEIGNKLNVRFQIDTSKSHPAVINDPDLYKKIKGELLERHMNFVELRKPSMIAEDFSFYEKKIPGVFFFLGTGTGIPLHSSNFNFDESILIEGTKLFNTIFTKA